MKAAVKAANANVYHLLKNNYFHAIPLAEIYAAVERTGLSIPQDEKDCILNRQSGPRHLAHDVPRPGGPRPPLDHVVQDGDLGPLRSRRSHHVSELKHLSGSASVTATSWRPRTSSTGCSGAHRSATLRSGRSTGVWGCAPETASGAKRGVILLNGEPIRHAYSKAVAVDDVHLMIAHPRTRCLAPCRSLLGPVDRAVAVAAPLAPGSRALGRLTAQPRTVRAPA